MSNWSRRAASTPPSGGERGCNTKATLVEFLDFEGYKLTTERYNIGEWNEGTRYFAEKGERKVLLDNPGKGERRDWAGMWSHFQLTQPMFD